MPALLLALANFAPLLTKYLGAGDTTQKVVNAAATIAQTVTGAATPEEAIQKMQQDQALAQQFQLAVMKESENWDKMYLEDTQDARKRDIELRKVGDKNYRANILVAVAFVIVVLCFAVVVWSSSSLNEYSKGIITLILGRALGWVEQIMSFEFGTTRSSKKKDDTIQQLSK